jgi:hypothetical protein
MLESNRLATLKLRARLVARIDSSQCSRFFFLNEPGRRAADYINKEEDPDRVSNTTRRVYNLKQQLQATIPTLPTTSSQQHKQTTSKTT